MQEKTISFSIVDDDAELRESIIQYLSVKGGFRFISKYSRAEEALAHLKADNPAVVLMDIKMKGMNGIECVRRLKEQMPGVFVIMLTVFEEDDLIFDAIKAGAVGYLLKSQPPGKLSDAIQEVVAGGSPMSATIARKVVQMLQGADGLGKTDADSRMLLSPRQREMLELLAAGQPYKIIADKMEVSIHTVRSYIRRTYEKLQVHTRTEAVAKYLTR